MKDKKFPMLGSPGRSIPWAKIAPHEAQAKINHGQTLEMLAKRGGLEQSEMVAVLEDRPFVSMDMAEAEKRLAALIR